MNKILLNKIVIIQITLLLSYIYCGVTNAEDNVITVYYDKVIGKINKNVFGNNFQAMDPRNHKYHAVDWVQNRAKYGGGVWNPRRDKPVREVMDLAREAGVSIVRYALSKYRMDNLVDTYDEAGNLIERPVKYGLDQFIETVNETGAKPVIIIPIHPDIVGGSDKDFSKRAQHASDIVEYLNTPVGENPDNDNDPHNENIAWAEIRAKNGHPNPYNVRYFEIGNEPYVRPNIGSKPQKGGSGVDFFWGYGSLFNKLAGAMKAVDPSVKTGLSLIAVLTDRRNKNILKIVDSDKLDYVILHMYFNQEADMDEGMDAEDAFLMNVSRPILSTDVKLKKFQTLIEDITGKSNVPLGISEYTCWNADLCDEQLASALLNAELLNIFMKPENNVLMANHWHMSNGSNGMIKAKNYVNHDYRKPIYYMKRPKYYVFEMYNKYFGDILIDTEMHGDTYDVRKYASYISGLLKSETPAQDTKIPYLSVNASKSADEKKVYLMVINKNMKKGITSLVELKNILAAKKAHAWILNGPSIKASNEKKVNNVDVKHEEFDIGGNFFKYTFQPHSLTAIEINTDHAF